MLKLVLGEFDLNQWRWLVPWAFGMSVVVFLGSLVGVWVILVRLPSDYLNRPDSIRESHQARPILHVVNVVSRNIAGVIFLAAGLVMLVTPGQGLLSIVVGIILLDFPGKRILIRKILGHPKVFSSINKLREKSGKPPLKIIELEPTSDRCEP